ncbi:MAG: hypothetical protein KF752_13925 [Pirellulaceae bacterium]|nr:hypothetical protein [Pirellulaceae bacterium]
MTAKNEAWLVCISIVRMLASQIDEANTMYGNRSIGGLSIVDSRVPQTSIYRELTALVLPAVR